MPASLGTRYKLYINFFPAHLGKSSGKKEDVMVFLMNVLETFS